MFGKIKQVTKQLLQEIIRSHPVFFCKHIILQYLEFAFYLSQWEKFKF